MVDITIISDLNKFAQKANKFYKDSIERIKSDLEFVGSNTFDQVDRDARGDKGAELKVPLLKQYCSQIINQYTKNPYAITVEGRKIEAQDKASILQGLIRGWESISDAQEAISLSVDRQVKCGLGYVVLYNEYTSNSGWDQDIKISPVLKPEMVIFDPYSKSLDGKDATECALVEHISRTQANDMCEEKQDFDYVTSPLEGTSWLAPEESVELVTYYKLKNVSETISMGNDNVTYTSDQKVPRGVKIVKERKVSKKVVCVYKIIGEQVVAKTELALSRLPVIPFRGEIIDKKDSLDWVGLVYFGKSLNRLINWTASLSGERIARSPKTTRYVDFRSIANYKDFWQKSNVLSPPFLPYDSKIGDDTFNPPTDSNPSVNISDTTQAQQNYQQLLSSVIGMSEAGSLTEQGLNETATSVLTRSKSSEVANYQFMNNTGKSIKAIGRVLVELMNIIYDTERLLPIMDENNEKQMIQMDYQQLNILPDELEISIDAGPMQATNRQEELSGLIALGTMLGPDVALSFADDIVSNTTWENSKRIANKLKSMASTKLGIVDPDAVDQGMDPEAQQALEAADQATQQLQQRLDEANQYINMLINEIQNNKDKLQLDREKMLLDYKKAIDVQLTKQSGDLNKLQLEKEAEADLMYQKQEAELNKELAKNTSVNIIGGYTPKYNSIDGLRTREF